MTAAYLERRDGAFEVGVETDPESALAALDGAEFDAIVSDYDMPGMDGVEFLVHARERNPDATLVLLTAADPAELAARTVPNDVVQIRKGRPGQSIARLADLLEPRA